jgi:hypothetical protein
MAAVPPEFQQAVTAIDALYHAPSNEAKKEASRWLEDFQAKVQPTHIFCFSSHHDVCITPVTPPHLNNFQSINKLTDMLF